MRLKHRLIAHGFTQDYQGAPLYSREVPGEFGFKVSVTTHRYYDNGDGRTGTEKWQEFRDSGRQGVNELLYTELAEPKFAVSLADRDEWWITENSDPNVALADLDAFAAELAAARTILTELVNA